MIIVNIVRQYSGISNSRIANGDEMQMKELQARLKEIRDQQACLYNESVLIVAELQGKCDHAETKQYKWEHDNGYGRQSWVTGKRCVFCGFLDLWGDDRFVNPDECFK